MVPLFFDPQARKHPSSIQERAIKEAYSELYALADAEKDNHFIFTSSGAEAINHVVFAAYIDITRQTGKNHFLCGSLDEAPSIMAMSRLESAGCVFQTVPASMTGVITRQAVAEMITPRTALLSLSWGNGLTGTIQPLEEIAELCHERGILFHVEGTHVIGKGAFAFQSCGADLLSFDGPYGGMGGLFIRSDLEISPFILGGQEQGHMRGGSLSIPLLLEFGKWAKHERAYTDHYCTEIARLRTLFEEKLMEAFPDVQILFGNQERLPHISSCIFSGVASETLAFALAQKEIQASFGGNRLQHFVHILKACGVPSPNCHCGLSFTFSSETTEEEITLGASLIGQTAVHMQKYSLSLLDEERHEL